MTQPVPAEVSDKWNFNDRFAWNYHMLTAPFEKREEGPIKSHWILPLVHGHVDQASEPCVVSRFRVPCLMLQQSLLYLAGSYL